jgi:tellurite resistance protein TehA-like permease
MLISTAFGIFIVVMAVIIAGINDKWGTAMVWIMVALIVLQGLFNVANFAQFVQNETFLPVGKTG